MKHHPGIQIELYDHQKKAIEELQTGSILWGGVGSGKSLTAVTYYYVKECGGVFDKLIDQKPMINPKDLYIITTARKRDSLDWTRECAHLGVIPKVVDSWNNIKKYTKVKNAFFIFDEQRVVGSGVWVRSFIKITKSNNWILLSATPGDTWLDYIPVFVANGFYKNRTEFVRNHVVYNSFLHFPKVDKILGTAKLNRLKKKILVKMDYAKPTLSYYKDEIVTFNQKELNQLSKERWNPYTDKPIKSISEMCHAMRRIINTDPSRMVAIKKFITKYQRIIVFYNFNYELDILRTLSDDTDLIVHEYNGHKHEPVPEGSKWVYLVQYTAGMEAWNCIETNVIIFYSLNYSYRVMHQSAGRIDRLNTPFTKLYYHRLRSHALIDKEIVKTLAGKKVFNEKKFVSQHKLML